MTTKQRLWRRLACGRNNKEFDDPGVESVREPFKNFDSRVFEAALQPADVGAVDTGVTALLTARQPGFLMAFRLVLRSSQMIQFIRF